MSRGRALDFVRSTQFSAIVLALAMGSASALTTPMKMSAVPCGINGFGRIGRLVARIMVKSPSTELKLVNSGAAADYMVSLQRQQRRKKGNKNTR